jgi:Domain of unknown function (DUF1707)
MPNQPSPDAPRTEVLARENLRASLEDRDEVVEELRVAAGDGRIDTEQLEQRIQAAQTARTYGQLVALLADLPTEPVARSAPAALATRSEPVAPVAPPRRSFWDWLLRRPRPARPAGGV